MHIRVSAAMMVTISLLASTPVRAQAVKDVSAPVVGTLGGALGSELAAPPKRNVPSLHPDDAAREIQRRHGGRVLSVQPDGSGYRVKVLKNGEVRIYQINP